MGIFDRFKRKPMVRHLVLTSAQMKYFKLAKGGDPIEQPQSSTKEKGEYETEGIPDYDAIDKLALYDPTIDGAANITTSAMLAGGYRLIHENPEEVKNLQTMFRRINFDYNLSNIVNKEYRYGLCYLNLVIEGSEVVDSQVMPPHSMFRVTKGKRSYVYKTIEGDEIDMDRNFLVSFEDLPKKDFAYPQSIFEPGLEILEDAARFNDQFRILIEEYIAPILHTTVGGDTIDLFPSQEDIDQIAKDVEESKRIGTELTTDKLVTITYVQPARGMDISPFLNYFERKIMLMAMVPEPYLMYRSVQAGGTDSQKQIESFHNRIRYKQKYHYETVINDHLIPMLYGDLPFDDKGVKEELDYTKYPRFEFEQPYEWKMRELNYIIKQVGVTITNNEGREKLGLSPLSDQEIEKMTQMGKKPVSRDPSEDVEDVEVRVDDGELDE
jgi:hypothetical protein